MTTRAHRLDDTDRRILALVQDDARITHAELGRRIGIAASAVFARLRALERAGLVRGYETRLDPAALGAGLAAFVFVSTSEPAGGLRTARRLAAIREVQEVHQVVGEDCLVVKVRVADNAALARLLRERFGTISTIRGTRTTIVLETVKETARFPLPNVRAARPGVTSNLRARRASRTP